MCVCVCESVSVFSGWDAQSQSWPSVFRTHSHLRFSPHFFPFSSSWLKRPRTYLHTGTDPDLDVFIFGWHAWAYRRWAAVFSLSLNLNIFCESTSTRLIGCYERLYKLKSLTDVQSGLRGIHVLKQWGQTTSRLLCKRSYMKKRAWKKPERRKVCL